MERDERSETDPESEEGDVTIAKCDRIKSPANGTNGYIHHSAGDHVANNNTKKTK